MKLSRWCLIGSLYMTQFLPVSFFFMGLPIILRSEGKSLADLSALFLLGFVWVIKIFWAPLIDRITFGKLGHYRGWLILMQSAMILTLLVMATIDGLEHFSTILILSLILTIFAATQDIATDALTARMLSVELRGIGNSFQVAGTLLGLIIGGGATLILYSHFGWGGCMILMASILLITLIQILLFEEGDHASTVKKDNTSASYSRLWKFWQQPKAGYWMMLLIMQPIGISMVFALIPAMLIDIGWTLEYTGFMLNVVGSSIAIVAVFATGFLIKIIDRLKLLFVATIAQTLIILTLIPLSKGEGHDTMLIITLISILLVYHPIATIMLTMMMDQVKEGSEGTDFTLQYSLYGFMSFLSGGLALQMAAMFSYFPIIIFSAFMAIISAIWTLYLYLISSRE